MEQNGLSTGSYVTSGPHPPATDSGPGTTLTPSGVSTQSSSASSPTFLSFPLPFFTSYSCLCLGLQGLLRYYPSVTFVYRLTFLRVVCYRCNCCFILCRHGWSLSLQAMRAFHLCNFLFSASIFSFLFGPLLTLLGLGTKQKSFWEANTHYPSVW